MNLRRILPALLLPALCLSPVSRASAQDTPPPPAGQPAPPAGPHRPMQHRDMKQDFHHDDKRGPEGHGEMHGPGGPGDMHESLSHILPPGMWWKSPDVATKIGLTADQQKKIDDIFLQSRVALIDMHASLAKEQLLLEPLLSANPVDQTKALAQIDKIAETRASLEKTVAKMLLSIRGVLTPDEWTKLQALHGPHGPGGPPQGGPGGMHHGGPPTKSELELGRPEAVNAE